MRRREFCIAALGAPLAPRLAAAADGQPQAVALEDIAIGGDLGRRAALNFDRLESPIYQPPAVFRSESADSWPGDWEGRVLLGVTLLARGTHRDARYLDDILWLYPEHFNAQGYFGPVLDPSAIDEQALSGHGWVLRALCEHYEWKRDERTLGMIDRIVRNLVLPTHGQHAIYPIDPATRKHGGGEAGSLTAQLGNWKLSSDIGCDFIFLDGVTHAAKVLPSPAIRAVAEEMIARFLEVDLVKIKAQTHATLTAIRALLRYADETGNAQLLKAAEDRYRLYRTEAMTENYENYNWFGRPQWTEGCAVIDSFIAATQLWRATANPVYLEDAHRIYFNGMGQQRSNGGFGTDTCAGAGDAFLAIRTFEAYWCCSMRGGEGHARAIEYAYFTRPGELSIPFFHNSRAKVKLSGGAVEVRQSTGYPYTGSVTLDVVSSTVTDPVLVRFAAPSWTSGHRLLVRRKTAPSAVCNGFVESRLVLRAGDTLQLNFDLQSGSADALNPGSIRGYHTFQAGPLLLGCETDTEIKLARNAVLEADGPGAFRVRGSRVRLSRVNDLSELNRPPSDKCKRQVMFSEA